MVRTLHLYYQGPAFAPRLRNLRSHRPGSVGSSPLKISCMETSLAIQWLGLCSSTAVDTGPVPGQRAKVPHAAWCSQKSFFS